MNNENKFILFMFKQAFDNYSAQQFASGFDSCYIWMSSLHFNFLPLSPLPVFFIMWNASTFIFKDGGPGMGVIPVWGLSSLNRVSPDAHDRGHLAGTVVTAPLQTKGARGSDLKKEKGQGLGWGRSGCKIKPLI